MPADNLETDLLAMEAEIALIREEIAGHRATLTAPAAPTAGLYWPAAEFAELLRRWPALADDYGDDHADYVHELELRLRELAADGVPALAVAPGNVEDFARYAADAGRAPDATDGLRADYAADLAARGGYVPWPPARDATCWCGSAARYATCCAKP